MAADWTDVEVDGRTVRVSEPGKVLFQVRKETKLELVEYYLKVGEAAVQAVRDRPMVLEVHPDGSLSYPERVDVLPAERPEWVQTITTAFTDGRTAEVVCPVDLAHLVWMVEMGCLGFASWPTRRGDLTHPDELRIQLDITGGLPFAIVRTAAVSLRGVLAKHGLTAYVQTDGVRGLQVTAPIESRYELAEVRAAGWAATRELQRLNVDLVTATGARPERGQRVAALADPDPWDRPWASAYSVRGNPGGLVACPVSWNELPFIELAEFSISTVPLYLSTTPDPFADVRTNAGSLEQLLELGKKLDERELAEDAAERPGRPELN